MADNGDRMFCHECGGVWLRNDAGLECPHCRSEFTEIIEVPPEVPDEHPSFSDGHAPPSPNERSRPPGNPFAGHNPWRDTEDGEMHGFGNGPGMTRRSYQSPDGRVTFTATTFSSRGGSPQQYGGGMPTDPLMPMLRSFDTIFHGLADTYMNQAQRETRPAGDRSPWASEMGGFPDPEERGGARNVFPAPRRLWPRDADNPQPMAHPLGNINDILDLFRPDFGPGSPPGRGGVRVMTGPNPLSIIASLLSMDRQGDAVYSQEELDRVISQLIDQNMNGNAPPPAPQSAISSLPKKKVDREMLGSEGKAECSICMDSVELGTEVTVLPCKHWFHYNCIEMWLSQHDTCPHCRRGISTPGQMGAEGTRNNPVVINSSPEPSSPRRRRYSTTDYYNNGNCPRPSHQSSSHNHSGGSPTQERRRPSRGEGHGGGISGWVRSRFGGAS